MILTRITNNINSFLYLKNSLYFAKGTSSKSKFTSKQDDFQTLQKQYAQQYFDKYREEVQKDSVIKNFRRQIFEKNNRPPEIAQYEKTLDDQQNHLNKLLAQGSKQKINKFSTKIMQHIKNNRAIFKGKQNKDVFRDYADYSAYSTNTVSIQDRNYLNMDNLSRSNNQSKTYQFIDSLPQNYRQKQQIRGQIQIQFPHQAGQMTISQFGKKLQQRHDRVIRYNETRQQIQDQNYFKMKNPSQDNDQKTVYRTQQQAADVETLKPFQSGTLSTQAINTIYDLYVQGWSVRQISRRFGILPARAKFYIWSRARVYNQFLPKLGLKFLFYAYACQAFNMQQNCVMDYGLDLDLMVKSERYEEIISWTSKTVDAQRTPDRYTQSLAKIQKKKQFGKYDMLQIGTDGKQNKKHLLKQWRIYRGKLSDEYFLRNKIFKGLMFENRKIKSVYY